MKHFFPETIIYFIIFVLPVVLIVYKTILKTNRRIEISKCGEICSAKPKCYGGIGRLLFGFILLSDGFFIACISVATNSTNYSAVHLLTYMAGSAIIVFATYWRLKNIGESPGKCLLCLIPIANIWVIVNCLILQRGFNDSETLDNMGKVTLAILVAVVLSPIVFLCNIS